MIREISTSTANKYGRGYHALRHNHCPNCERETERTKLDLGASVVVARKCPWCTRSVVSRLAIGALNRLRG